MLPMQRHHAETGTTTQSSITMEICWIQILRISKFEGYMHLRRGRNVFDHTRIDSDWLGAIRKLPHKG